MNVEQHLISFATLEGVKILDARLGVSRLVVDILIQYLFELPLLLLCVGPRFDQYTNQKFRFPK